MKQPPLGQREFWGASTYYSWMLRVRQEEQRQEPLPLAHTPPGPDCPTGATLGRLLRRARAGPRDSGRGRLLEAPHYVTAL